MIILTESQTCPDECSFCLFQSDFDVGTYRVTQSGTYCLSENIEFNPLAGDSNNPNINGGWFPTDPDQYPGSTTSSSGAFALGFFAAICIESDNVIFDLNDKILSMGLEFYLQQRFFALIEIGSSPFLPNVGPADFGQDFVEVSDVTIKNGELGLSSHHGIHGNNVTNVIIENLRIYDFEVAGVHLNGFLNAKIRNLNIGPSYQQVPFSGITMRVFVKTF